MGHEDQDMAHCRRPKFPPLFANSDEFQDSQSEELFDGVCPTHGLLDL